MLLLDQRRNHRRSCWLFCTESLSPKTRGFSELSSTVRVRGEPCHHEGNSELRYLAPELFLQGDNINRNGWLPPLANGAAAGATDDATCIGTANTRRVGSATACLEGSWNRLVSSGLLKSTRVDREGIVHRFRDSSPNNIARQGSS